MYKGDIFIQYAKRFELSNTNYNYQLIFVKNSFRETLFRLIIYLPETQRENIFDFKLKPKICFFKINTLFGKMFCDFFGSGGSCFLTTSVVSIFVVLHNRAKQKLPKRKCVYPSQCSAKSC